MSGAATFIRLSSNLAARSSAGTSFSKGFETNSKPGLAAFLFSKADVSDYACRQRRKQTGEIYSAPEAAKLLGVTQDVVYFLTRQGILSSRSRANERYSDLLVGKDDLEEFNSAYIFPAKLAKQFSTVSRYLTRLWATQGIHPVSELLDELLKDYQKPEDLLGQDGLLQQLTKALVERALGGELTHHLGYEKHAPEGRSTGNSRNGTTPKTLRGKRGQIQIDVPRDRNSEFEPQLVKKGQTRFDGLDENIISLYARGMTQREIQGHLEEIYGVEISPSLISTVTDAVMDEARAWQARPLDSVYPILYLDALQVKVKSQGRVTSKAIYLAFGVNLQGLKEVLGMWAAETEGAKFWMQVVTELKNRGVQDIFIACVDGLKGFPEAIEAVFPQAQVQLCMVHLVRHSLSYVSHKDRKQVANDLKAVYQAATLEEGERQLAEFEEAWAASYPVIAKSWRANWPRVVPMFGYPAEIRRVIYTTNTIESLIMTLRKVSKNRPLFPSDEAVFKLLYLALRNISNRWTMPIPNWSGALNQFAILFDGRVPMGGINSNSLTQTA